MKRGEEGRGRGGGGGGEMWRKKREKGEESGVQRKRTMCERVAGT